MYYIMRASQVIFGKNRASLSEIIRELGGSGKRTVLVVRRSGHDTGSKERKTFVSGWGWGYNETVGKSCMYTEDTGMGYANRCQRFTVENVIEYENDVLVRSLNDIGLNESRSVWVMK